jgi:hypothetical protein
VIQALRLQVSESRTVAGRAVARGDGVGFQVSTSVASGALYITTTVEVHVNDIVRLERYIGQPDTILRCIAPSGAVKLFPRQDIRPYLDACFDRLFGPEP